MIYVGRLDYNQKRVHRLAETWALVEHRFPDWRLTIVGDGTERGNLERLVAQLGLRNVRFEGFRPPKPYYERASVLLLASEYEGFPLVLAECMSFGVVPVVYGSYSAVYDIIDDGTDGLVVPYDKAGFHAERMAERLSTLLADTNRRNVMAINALQKSRNYSLDSIYAQWQETLSKFCKL